MTGNNKILTVSYGTFSCTLEGFDDSFGTMKAIAEYFRELSADDRYFGAEPTQPDVQMLAHIAQSETTRRVKARESGGKIILSANQEAMAQAESVTDAAGISANVVDSVGPEAPPAAQNDDNPAETLNVEPTESAPPETTIFDGNEVDDSKFDLTPQFTVDADEDPIEISGEAEDRMRGQNPAIDEPAPTAVGLQNQFSGSDGIVPGQLDATINAFFEEGQDRPDLAPDNEEEYHGTAAPTAPVSASIAAKLQRIRSVVSQQAQNVAPESSVDEPENMQSAGAEFNDTPELENAEPVDAETVHPDTAELSETTGSDNFETAADENDVLLQSVEADADNSQGDTPDSETAVPKKNDTIRPPIDENAISETVLNNNVVKETLRDISNALEADDENDDISVILDRLAANDDDEDENTNVDLDHEIEEAGISGEDEGRGDADSNKQTIVPPDTGDSKDETVPSLRVLKVKRSDLESALETSTVEEYAGSDKNQPSLSEAEEDDLAQELAKVAAELQDNNATPVVAADHAKDAAPNDTQETVRSQLPNIDEKAQSDDLSRLMATSDTHMGDAESANRRDAFAHLRAAVAAKKADSAIESDSQVPDDGGAYRNDLASVVHPRRPTNAVSRTARPGEDSSAPLKLVAEQRVDTMVVRPAGPVRPRRVSADLSDSNTEVSKSGFIEFAEEAGAVKLPDLLEAAAAYMSYVEGREQFSRPQLMTKVRQVKQEDFSREDGLRHFGNLLRDGKIQKMKGGRFQASDRIGFRPDERAAG